MSTVAEMVVTNPVESNIDENIRRFLELIVTGDVPVFQAQMLRHTSLNVSSPRIFDGSAPLHMAALHRKLEIAELILDSPGVSVEVVNAKDRFGYTPLQLAVLSECADLVTLLATYSLTTLDVAATSERDDRGEDCDGCTSLHVAALIQPPLGIPAQDNSTTGNILLPVNRPYSPGLN